MNHAAIREQLQLSVNALQPVIAFAETQPVAAVAAVAVLLALVYFACSPSKRNLVDAPSVFNINKSHGALDVDAVASYYTDIHSHTGTGTEAQRKSAYDRMVNAYYTLATDFYEMGWGQSFHFGTRWPHETLAESLVRHEYYLAARLGLREGQRVLDVGCGVGGPARNIARFSGAHITGVSLNDYQVARANAKAAAEGLGAQATFLQADFMKLDEALPAASFDAAYAIEATCHAPDRAACFAQVFRALKPGSAFGGYEWVTTDLFDAANPEHVALMHEIEVGNGLPTTRPAADVRAALEAAGFAVEVLEDLAPRSPVPWYAPFTEGPLSVRGFGTSRVGIFLTHAFVAALEALWLAPAGSSRMHANLAIGARSLTAAGKLGIFTVMLHFVARKPALPAMGAAAAVAHQPAAASKRPSAASIARSLRSPASISL